MLVSPLSLVEYSVYEVLGLREVRFGSVQSGLARDDSMTV